MVSSEDPYADTTVSEFIIHHGIAKAGRLSTPLSGQRSVFLDVHKPRLTFSPSSNYTKSVGGQERPSIEKMGVWNQKISSEILRALTPDKISELKYIFQICDSKNNGEILYSEVTKSK